MAFGYAQTTGKPGVYTVVPGPGLLNTGAALCTAWACNSPVLAVIGQLNRDEIGSGYGHLHEIDDQLGLVKHLTKWAARIDDSTETPTLMKRAFEEMQSGRPRPVEVEMPMDVMGDPIDIGPALPVEPAPPPAIDDDTIAAAAKLLAGAKRPLIVIGSGALNAGTELLRVAERLQAPVMAKRKGKGVVAGDHYLSQNLPAGHRLWGDADVVLAVGTRLKMPLTMWGKDDDLKLIRVDIDAEEITRICEPDVAVHGDAVDALNRMADVLDQTGSAAASREDELVALKGHIDAEVREHVGPQMAYLDAIRDVMASRWLLHRRGDPGWVCFLVRLSPSIDRVSLSARRSKVRLATVSRPASALRRHTRTKRSYRSPETAASCSTCRNWRPPPSIS